MISTQDRRDAVMLIDEAVAAGARLFMACAELGLCRRTYRRWLATPGEVKGDGRAEAQRPPPANALTETERAKLIEVACRPEFANLPPSQIVPTLADRGEYLASKSSFYRVLRAHDLQSGSQELLTPGPHTTHHAGPQWAVQRVGALDESQ